MIHDIEKTARPSKGSVRKKTPQGSNQPGGDKYKMWAVVIKAYLNFLHF